jgi:transcriptional regulator with XRE-family HTH domain
MTEPFGTRLRAARLERGITQKALAELGGITPASLNLLEKGRNKMVRADVAIRMADAMGVSTRWMVLGDGRPEIQNLDSELLVRVIRFCDKGVDELALDLGIDQRAELIAMLYKMALDPDSAGDETVLSKAGIAMGAR